MFFLQPKKILCLFFDKKNTMFIKIIKEQTKIGIKLSVKIVFVF
jgi:hypothetical protein